MQSLELFSIQFWLQSEGKGFPRTASYGGTGLEVPPEKDLTDGSRVCLT